MQLSRCLLALALLVVVCLGVAGCGGDDGCGDCPQGCCREGQCVVSTQQSAVACGTGGAACQDCTVFGATCDATAGACVGGVTPAPTADGGVITPTPGPQPDPVDPCANCAGCCDPSSGSCIPEGAACAGDGAICRAGVCQKPPQSSCPSCNAPWQCVSGRCIGPVELCQQRCDGCCTNEGKCLPRGTSQSDYTCGQGGEMCADCTLSRQVCSPQRGVCEVGSGGKWEICPIRAVVDRRYVDCGWTGDKPPDIYLRYRLGGQTMKTRVVQAMDKPEGWEGVWVDSCVTLDADMAGLDGMVVVASDSDWGTCADFIDDTLGSCVLYTSAATLADKDGFIRVGTTSCRADMIRLDLKYRPLPLSSGR
jgi:hypothetical protein